MTWLLVLPLGLALWWLWDIRRLLNLRLIPRKQVVIGPADATIRASETYRGAVAPARYEVVRWPSGTVHYNGSHPTQAKQVYEHQHPIPGEAVELWEQGTCRGHKEA